MQRFHLPSVTKPIVPCRALVTDSPSNRRQTPARIAMSFVYSGVPLPFITSQPTLANLQAAEHQHLAKAIAPRLQRRDEKLNEQLVPLFDPSGRLFLASD